MPKHRPAGYFGPGLVAAPAAGHLVALWLRRQVRLHHVADQPAHPGHVYLQCHPSCFLPAQCAPIAARLVLSITYSNGRPNVVTAQIASKYTLNSD